MTAFISTAPLTSVPPKRPMVFTTRGQIHQGSPFSSISKEGVANMKVGYWKRRWRYTLRLRGSEGENLIPWPSGRRTTWTSWDTMSTTI